MLFEVVDVLIEYSSENVCGSITRGCLKGRGILASAVCQQNAPSSWESRTIRGRRVEENSGHSIDLDQSTGPSRRELTYLPILNVKNEDLSDQVLGLMLKPTHEKKDKFQRVGRFIVDGKYKLRRMLKQRRRNGTWVSIPKRNFTIV